MNRRRFLQAALAGVVSAPLVAEAEQAGKAWRVGLIAVTHIPGEDAFFQRLRELGYVEGQNLTVERRYSEGRAERFQEFAADLVRRKVDIIIVGTTPAALAVESATKTIPVVFPTAIDPVGAGLVASLARPGDNITGLTNQAPELAAKRLQLLKETIPSLSRVAVLWNAANPGNARLWFDAQDAARTLGLRLQSEEVRQPTDFERVFTAMTRQRPRALLFIGDALTLQHAPQIVDFVIRKRIPSMLDREELAAAGGLMSYGAHPADLWRRAAELAQKIVTGARPADLPFEQATRFELVVNLKAARALGLTLPPALLARADQVIDP
jgi:putative tryptophan/tyrosine transport system substrate-binding protein